MNILTVMLSVSVRMFLPLNMPREEGVSLIVEQKRPKTSDGSSGDLKIKVKSSCRKNFKINMQIP